MSEGVWKIFVSLGVPGVALGIFYAFLRAFSWDLSSLNPMIQVGLVILFLLIVAFITLMTLHMWRPNLQVGSRSSVSIGSGSTIRSGIAGRDLKQGLISSELPEIANLSSESSVEIGKSVSIQGSVAGRDILINNDRLPDRTEELASILEDRASRIKAELVQHFHYTPVQKFLDRFDQLHADHVEALRQGHLVRAHEILNKIHELSFNLQHGSLIEEYVGSEAMEKLVEKLGMNYLNPPNRHKEASDIYSIIFKSRI
jgi:hypothetical protein